LYEVKLSEPRERALASEVDEEVEADVEGRSGMVGD
jgi:hypothetical protein